MRPTLDFYGPYALANNPMYPHRIEMRQGGVLYQVKPALLNSLLIPWCGRSHGFTQTCIHIGFLNRRIEPGNKLRMGFGINLD
jgi:hypothetical protein